MHSAQFYDIMPDELNRKTAGAFLPMHCTAEKVKGKRVQIPHDLVTVIRESASGCFAPATGALLWEGDAGRRSFSQETCPLLVRGRKPQITRNWLYQKALKQQRSFCHAIRRTERPFFSSLFPVPFVWFKPQFIQQERTRTMRKIATKKLAPQLYGSGSVPVCSPAAAVLLPALLPAPLRLPPPAKRAARRLTKWQQRTWQT